MPKKQDGQQDPAPSQPRFLWRAIGATLILAIGISIAVILGLFQIFESSENGAAFSEDYEKQADEKPFYSINENIRGPLSLSELQINIPAELEQLFTPQRRACFLQKIGELAQVAGDPETLDPSDVDYLPTDGTWDNLDRFHRRLLLGQAIVSRAGALC